jgi:hypothetical protein
MNGLEQLSGERWSAHPTRDNGQLRALAAYRPDHKMIGDEERWEPTETWRKLWRATL